MGKGDIIKSAAKVITRELGLDFPDNRLEELVRGLERSAVLLGGEIDYVQIANEILETQTIPEKYYKELSIALTINETYFFREKPALDFIQEIILKEIRECVGDYIIWSAGCSSGEEPYTIAMLLKEGLTANDLGKVRIVATDISDKALKKAKEGSYTQWSFRETPEIIRKKYFSKKGNEWQISEDIRKLVTFGHLNLFKDSFTRYFKNEGNINLILCRNVLMYFSHDNIRNVLGKFYKMLREKGWFVTSQVELNNELFENFGRVYSHGALFYRKTNTHSLPAVNTPIDKSQHQKKAILPKALRAKPKPVDFEKRQEALPTVDNQNDNSYQQAVEFAGKGDFDKATEILDNLLSGENLKPVFFYLYGTIYSEMGKKREAAEMFRKSLYLEPDNILSSYMLGNIYNNDGKNELAKRYFTNAYENLATLDPDTEIEGSEGLTAARLVELIKINIKG
jgi:chemotaxis protein methyltransferase CheR